MYSNDNPRIHVVIPARFSSSRLPGKPLVDLAGQPMIVRVYQRVFSAFDSATIIVATDDKRIADVLANNSIPFCMTNESHESGSDRIAEVSRIRGWHDDDIIINVQGDEPLIPVALLKAFRKYCSENKNFDLATISAPIEYSHQVHDTNIVKVCTDSLGHALYFSRSVIPFCRDMPEENWLNTDFSRHVGIYAYKNSSLQRLTNSPVCRIEALEKLEQLRALWLGMKIAVMPWSESPPHGVDTPEDISRIIDSVIKEAS